MPTASVVGVSQSADHRFSKGPAEKITIVEGLGVLGDAHAGETVQHVFLAQRDPGRPNLRQVHLLDAEVLAAAAEQGFDVLPGDLGENITTQGLPDPPPDTLLSIGSDVVLRVTGARFPCAQIDGPFPGLFEITLARDEKGKPTGRLGIMTVVEHGGVVRPGDSIAVTLPPQPHRDLPYV